MAHCHHATIIANSAVQNIGVALSFCALVWAFDVLPLWIVKLSLQMVINLCVLHTLNTTTFLQQLDGRISACKT